MGKFGFAAKLIGTAVCISAVIGAAAFIADRVNDKKQKKEHGKHYKHSERRKGFYEKNIKRPLDCVLSVWAFAVLSPVIGITALLVRIKLGSPVIFTQTRPGRYEKNFDLKKFRSMSNAVDKNGELLPDSERLTPFGKMLRASSLDELPELLNIIKGDMALIGPRPLAEEYTPYYTEEEHHRHDVRPGLSGLAQISGRNALQWEDRFGYDLEYAKNITFIGDAKIVLKTILKVFRKEDVAVRGETEIRDFNVHRQAQWDSGAVKPPAEDD